MRLKKAKRMELQIIYSASVIFQFEHEKLELEKSRKFRKNDGGLEYFISKPNIKINLPKHVLSSDAALEFRSFCNLLEIVKKLI